MPVVVFTDAVELLVLLLYIICYLNFFLFLQLPFYGDQLRWL